MGDQIDDVTLALLRKQRANDVLGEHLSDHVRNLVRCRRELLDSKNFTVDESFTIVRDYHNAFIDRIFEGPADA